MFGKERINRSIRPTSLSTIDSGDDSNLHDRVALNKPEATHSPMSGSPNLQHSGTSTMRNQRAESSTAATEMLQHPPKPVLTRVPSVQTRYMEMLLHLDHIPRIYNILSAACTWILLAGFLVIPGTFTSFKNSDAFKNSGQSNESAVAEAIINSIANIGLLWLSGAFCGIGALGCLFMWFRWRKNYVWLINRIFMPTLLNSIAGLLTTVVNVYTAQQGVWSVTAKVTAIVTSSVAAVAGGLFALYNFWVLEKVKDSHQREYKVEGEAVVPKNEGFLAKFKRKAKEPALQPGSIV